MAYSSMTARAAGYIVSAANDWNKMVANFAAIWVGTTAGDMDYYTSSTAKTRIPKGTDGQVLQMVAGVPAWGWYTNYIVGDIHISTSSANPATALGYGTWAAFGSGRVLVGIDAGQTEFDTVEETGGAKTHTLQTTEIPAHNHTYNNYSSVQNVDGGAATAAFNVPATGNTGNAGGGAAHNNLQPYIVVYMWKRTA
jgi:hypothetical protein